jgi:hypothetical protein
LIHRQIIWAKPVLLLGRGDYHWKHELCFYGWVRGNRPPFYGPRNQTTVWEIAGVKQGERADMNHPTPKPVALWMQPIDNHTKPGEVMYEPFSGSGSQIIAAEQTGRRCYAMELSPNYVDVAVRRWQQYTGRTATLEATGEPFPTQATACTQLSRHSGVGRNPGGGDNKTSIYHAFLDVSYRKPSRRQSPQPFLTPAFAGETVPLRCVHTVAARGEGGRATNSLFACFIFGGRR